MDGGNRFEFFNDLWEFDGAHWSALPSSGERMSGIGLAFDTKRKRLLSFGGYAGQSRGELRVLSNNEWKTIGKHAEIVAAEPGFVYDSKRDRFVAFGGSAGRGLALGDTWELDDTAWRKLAAAGPPPRQAHSMVFDSKRGRTVVFGGIGTGPAGQRPPTLGDTWEFDGRSWTKLDVVGPAPRASGGVAFDSKRGLVILFGGSGDSGFYGDTWSWNGSEWKKLAETGPEARAMGYMAYDRKRDRIVLFGGRKGWPDGDLADTWEWNGTSWTKIGG